MTELLTAAQMRAIEQAAIDSGEVTGLELMERAGQGVVDAVFKEWPELADAPCKAVVLCGPGNNGGDGFVVARLLKDAGWEVEVYLYGEADKLPPDARMNYERWGDFGGVTSITSELEVTHLEPDVIIDALFGTGLKRPIEGLFQLLLDLNEDTAIARGFHCASCRLTAIDLPSGVCSDSGNVLAPSNWTEEVAWWQPTNLHCQLTVTFHRPKLGHYLAGAPISCGKVVVADIGLPPSSGPENSRRRLPKLATCEPFRLEKAHGHKFAHGHALILSGGPGQTGAARLAARGALRVGAGLVTLGVPPAAQQEVACQVTAIMLKRVADGAALEEALTDERINALCLGPALGLTDTKVGLIEAALASGRACVLDADALTLIARSPALFAMLHEACVLTPHGGEFARLFPDITEKLDAPASRGPAYSKVDATREAAARVGCTVLFKGPDTVIAGPDGSCRINSSAYVRAAPWLATAGSGDVLAGFITGLLARGGPPLEAAETGAWLHTECALQFGPGLIAEDLPEQLPTVFRALSLV